MVFRKDEWALRRTGGFVVKFVWVWYRLLVSSPVMGSPFLVNETPGKEMYDK